MLFNSISQILCPTDIEFPIFIALKNICVKHTFMLPLDLPAMLRIALQAGDLAIL